MIIDGASGMSEIDLTRVTYNDGIKPSDITPNAWALYAKLARDDGCNPADLICTVLLSDTGEHEFRGYIQEKLAFSMRFQPGFDPDPDGITLTPVEYDRFRESLDFVAALMKNPGSDRSGRG